MIEYLQELRVKDGNQVRIINSHIFKEKCMTDDELEAKKIEFSKKNERYLLFWWEKFRDYR